MATTAKKKVVFDPIAQFNSGKGFVTSDGGIEPEKHLFHIETAVLKESNYKNQDGTPQYQIEMQVICDDMGGDKIYSQLVWQGVTITKNGVMQNPAWPSYKKKDGTIHIPSELWEILEASKAYDEKVYEKAKADNTNKDGSRNWMGFLKSLSFEFPARVGDKKDGTGGYCIIQTQKRMEKQEADAIKYRAENNIPEREPEGNLDDIKVAGEEIKEVLPENGEINPSDLPY